MKKFQVILLIFFIGVLIYLGTLDSFAAFNPYRPRCVGIQGTFTANSTWTGGSIQVGCAGDDGLAVSDPAQRCTGEVLTVRPGQTYRLTKCSCFGSDKGCLRIGKTLKLEPLVNGKRKITVVTSLNQVSAFTQNSCRATDVSNVCGTNGQHITGNIRIICQVPSSTPTRIPTPTTRLLSTTPSPTRIPTPTARIITSTPTPTRTPTRIPTPTARIITSTPTPTPIGSRTSSPTPTTVDILGQTLASAYAEEATPSPTPTPSMEPTGNPAVMAGGIIGGILVILGGIILLLL
jgi:hypothetical protein